MSIVFPDASARSFTMPAFTDEVTGISLPTRPASAPWEQMVAVWGQVADWMTRQLISCGYLQEAACTEVLGSYHQHLVVCDEGRMPEDFLAWLAQRLPTTPPEGSNPDEELRQIQSAVHARVFEQQPLWRFGDLPGRLWSQAAENLGRRRLLTLLRCASLASEDGTLVHVVGFNPVAVRLATRWLAVDETSHAPGDNPSFIFPFVVGREVWRRLYERQFPDEPS